MKTELYKKMRAIHKKNKMTLREYIATRSLDEQNFWNSPARPMHEIIRHKYFWMMMWHLEYKPFLISCAAGSICAAAALYALYYTLFIHD